MSGRRGLGLLEALVALATAAVLLAALAGVVAGAARARERGTAAAEQVGTARTVLLRLGSELAAALPAADPAAPERFVATRDAGRGPASRLRFAIAGDDPGILAYAVEHGALVRRSASRFAPPDAGEPAAVPLVDGVHALGVRCFDGQAWRDTWARGGLPRAVELTLDLGDGAPLVTTVALPLGAPS